MDYAVILTNSLQAAFGPLAVFYALLALGLNIHFGYAGLLNFGQAGFAMLGAYSIAVMSTTYGLSLWIGVLAAIVSATIFALLLGIPTLRLRADYLAIVTIAAAEILNLVIRSPSSTPVTNGTRGISQFSQGFDAVAPWDTAARFDFFGIRYSGKDLWNMTVGWSLVALVCLLTWMLMRSPWGRVLKAIREDEDAARSLGKNVYLFKMQALILGGIIGALGGVMYAFNVTTAQPDAYQTSVTFFAYTVLILGGAARVFGPVVGAILFYFLLAFTENVLVQLTAGSDPLIPPEILTRSDAFQIRFIIVGIGLMLLLIFRPQGIFGDRREVSLDAR
ncbi:MAG: branched-chain amino acid ABC transporter permease [Geodermatophilaceae bacterium]|nr:branched-chain amino acid ABC transporter permease [Geodermatophilaceae bacterium]MDQ3455197.1 branched-chain amino acid ABC transporter permease [Actinomycetota bacterium]